MRVVVPAIDQAVEFDCDDRCEVRVGMACRHDRLDVRLIDGRHRRRCADVGHRGSRRTKIGLTPGPVWPVIRSWAMNGPTQSMPECGMSRHTVVSCGLVRIESDHDEDQVVAVLLGDRR